MTFKPIGLGPIGSIGKTVPIFQHRIVDAAGNDVPPGEPGELLFRATDGSPYVVEYYKNPEASAKKCAGGWLHMGDIVREDENGWLYFLYRQGGGIRRNGDFVNPGFVEKAVAEFETVDDVFVYGVPPRCSRTAARASIVMPCPPISRSWMRSRRRRRRSPRSAFSSNSCRPIPPRCTPPAAEGIPGETPWQRNIRSSSTA